MADSFSSQHQSEGREFGGHNLRKRPPLHGSPRSASPRVRSWGRRPVDDKTHQSDEFDSDDQSPSPPRARPPRPRTARAGHRTPPAAGWRAPDELRRDSQEEKEEEEWESGRVRRSGSGAEERRPEGWDANLRSRYCEARGQLGEEIDGDDPNKSEEYPRPGGLSAAKRSPVRGKAVQKDDPGGDWQTIVLCGLLALGLLVGVYVYWGGAAPAVPRVELDGSQPLQASVHRWVESVAELAAQFPFQRPRLWQVLRAAVNRMLVQTRQPAVVLLLAGEESRAEAACLLRQAAAAALNATGWPERAPLVVSGAALAPLDEREAKGRLGARLDSLRGGTGVDVVIVEDLQRLQPRTAMLLHGFCDNDNAPRKEAVFLFSVVAAEQPPAADRFAEDVMERELWKAWGAELGEDIFRALLGRIAGNVAAVAGEGDNLLCRRQTAV